MDREFSYTLIDYLPNGKRIAHGTCTVCAKKIMKDTGDAIWIRASCPECKVEISIYTFDGDASEPLRKCGECSYSGDLTIVEMLRGNVRIK